LGIASPYLFAAFIPAVRNEVASFKDLLSAFKPSGQIQGKLLYEETKVFDKSQPAA